MARLITSVHVDIARFVLEVSEISLESTENPDKIIADWTRGLMRCLARRDPSLHAYGAFLLSEMDEYRKLDSERKKANRHTDIPRNPPDSKDSVESSHSTDQESTDQERKEDTEAADGVRGFPHSEKKPKKRVPPKIERPILPPSLSENPAFMEAWDGFIEMRRKVKKPMTDKAKRMLLSDLRKHSEEDVDTAIAILNKSIYSSWQGVYPLKSSSQNSGSNFSRQQRDDDTRPDLDFFEPTRTQG